METSKNLMEDFKKSCDTTGILLARSLLVVSAALLTRVQWEDTSIC